LCSFVCGYFQIFGLSVAFTTCILLH
jgi:hypothetical protein